MNENEIQQNQTIEENIEVDKNKNSNGPLIGAIIVVLLLIILGVYVFTNREKTSETLNEEQKIQIEEGIVNIPDEQKKSLEEQSSSDALNIIEEDTNNTDLDNLDLELQAIEQELDEL